MSEGEIGSLAALVAQEPLMRHTPIAPARSNRAEIRNPILALPAMARLRALDPSARLALQELLLDLQQDARSRAEASW